MATPYYPYPTPTFAPPPFQPQPPSHMQPAISPQSMHSIMQPPPQCNGQPPEGMLVENGIQYLSCYTSEMCESKICV